MTLKYCHRYKINEVEILLVSDMAFDEPFYSTLSCFVSNNNINSKINMFIEYCTNHNTDFDVDTKNYYLVSSLPYINVYKSWDINAHFIYQILFYAEDKQTSKLLLLNIAFCNCDFSEIKIIGINNNLRKINTNLINPLSTSVGSTLLLGCYLQSNDLGLSLHASAVTYYGKAIIFVGPSGAGKSTMREIWQSFGHTAIGNDRIIIDSKMMCTGTPYERTIDWIDHKAYNVIAMFYISHGKENIISTESNILLFYKLMKQCIVPVWLNNGIVKTVMGVNNILKNIPVYSFSFIPNESAYRCCIEFIKTNL